MCVPVPQLIAVLVDAAHDRYSPTSVTATAKSVYSAIMSLDGYSADENGDIDWGAPDAEVHAFINELER